MPSVSKQSPPQQPPAPPQQQTAAASMGGSRGTTGPPTADAGPAQQREAQRSLQAASGQLPATSPAAVPHTQPLAPVGRSKIAHPQPPGRAAAAMPKPATVSEATVAAGAGAGPNGADTDTSSIPWTPGSTSSGHSMSISGDGQGGEREVATAAADTAATAVSRPSVGQETAVQPSEQQPTQSPAAAAIVAPTAAPPAVPSTMLAPSSVFKRLQQQQQQRRAQASAASHAVDPKPSPAAGASTAAHVTGVSGRQCLHQPEATAARTPAAAATVATPPTVEGSGADAYDPFSAGLDSTEPLNSAMLVPNLQNPPQSKQQLPVDSAAAAAKCYGFPPGVSWRNLSATWPGFREIIGLPAAGALRRGKTPAAAAPVGTTEQKCQPKQRGQITPAARTDSSTRAMPVVHSQATPKPQQPASQPPPAAAAVVTVSSADSAVVQGANTSSSTPHAPAMQPSIPRFSTLQQQQQQQQQQPLATRGHRKLSIPGLAPTPQQQQQRQQQHHQQQHQHQQGSQGAARTNSSGGLLAPAAARRLVIPGIGVASPATSGERSILQTAATTTQPHRMSAAGHTAAQPQQPAAPGHGPPAVTAAGGNAEAAGRSLRADIPGLGPTLLNNLVPWQSTQDRAVPLGAGSGAPGVAAVQQQPVGNVLLFDSDYEDDDDSDD